MVMLDGSHSIFTLHRAVFAMCYMQPVARYKGHVTCRVPEVRHVARDMVYITKHICYNFMSSAFLTLESTTERERVTSACLHTKRLPTARLVCMPAQALRGLQELSEGHGDAKRRCRASDHFA